MKKLLILTTGGTIAATQTPGGYAPSLGVDLTLPETLCDIRHILNIDSTNMRPEDWVLIAREVYEGLAAYDGVIITHGTDTMAYTASMLSFMLKNLTKPVIITGSQRPPEHPESDAKKNLSDAALAATSGLAGVYIVFGGKILSGTQASKTHTTALDAFESIHAPVDGRIENGGVVVLSPRKTTGQTELDTALCPDVFLLKIIPGTKPEMINTLVSMGHKGIMIEAFGLGGVPKPFLEPIRQAVSAGVAVVVTTQCRYGDTDLTVYEVGKNALDAGVIPANGLTSEAAVTMLMWLLGHDYSLEEIRVRIAGFTGLYSERRQQP